MDVKMPNKASIDLTGIRVEQSLSAIAIPTPEALVSTRGDSLILTKRKCIGLAPFVGDSRTAKGFYSWPVWMDDSGMHWISGDADLSIVPAL